MAGSACYNIVYMSERVGTVKTYRVTGGKNNSLAIKRDVILLLIQNNVIH